MGLFVVVVQFRFLFEIRLHDLDEFPEQFLILYGYEFLRVFVVLRFYDFHDVEVHGLFIILFAGTTALVSVAAALVLLLGVAQHNVFFSVVIEIADDLQKHFVAIFIDAFDEILILCAFCGHATQFLILITVQWNHLAF